MRYIRVDQLGKSYAMNYGLSIARNNVVVATDDDCEVPVEWEMVWVMFAEPP